VSPSAISNCWKKAKLKPWSGAASEFKEQEINFDSKLDQATIDKWMQADGDLETSPPDTDMAIVNEVQGNNDQ